MKKFMLLVLLSIAVSGKTLTGFGIVTEYDETLRSAVSVKYTVTKDMLEYSRDKRLSFRADKRLKRVYRTYSSWYRNTGYDRGHLAPDAVFDYSYSSLKYVYQMSNIVPQHPKLNRRAWKSLEKYVRLIAKQTDVTVTIGVLYEDGYKRIGKLNIPTGFTKRLDYDFGGKHLSKCFYFKNEKAYGVKSHIVSCKDKSVLYSY